VAHCAINPTNMVENGAADLMLTGQYSAHRSTTR
jgi:hypothetical protein